MASLKKTLRHFFPCKMLGKSGPVSGKFVVSGEKGHMEREKPPGKFPGKKSPCEQLRFYPKKTDGCIGALGG